MALRWQLKTLMDPGGGGDTILAGDPLGMKVTNDRITLPLCNQETAEVTISTHDTEAANAAMSPYDKRLVCHLFDVAGGFDYPIFDGIVTEPELDTENATITIPATDHSLRMVNHFIRLGDRVLNGPDHPDFPNLFNKKVPVTGEGFRMIMEAAHNLDPDQTANYPPLGIDDDPGFDESWDDTNLPPLAYQRGDQVWQALLDFTSGLFSPEFQFIPVEDSDFYAVLYTTVKRGLHDPVNGIWIPNSSTASAYINSGWEAGDDMPLSNAQFQAGFGKWNCEIKHKPGGKLVTHVHTLSDTGRIRVTVASPPSAEQHGVYVHWEQTDYKTDEEAILRQRGRQILSAYQSPLNNLEIEPNGLCEYRFMRDYLVGSIVRGSYHSGVVEAGPFNARIVQVELKGDQNDLSGFKTSLTVQPDLGTVDVTEDS